jgi:hypothetical protein
MHHISVDGRSVFAHRQEHSSQASDAIPAMLKGWLASTRTLTPTPVFHPVAKPANVVGTPRERAMIDQDPYEAELERRLQKEWGPDIPLWKRRLFAVFVIVAFFGLILAALVNSSR